MNLDSFTAKAMWDTAKAKITADRALAVQTALQSASRAIATAAQDGQFSATIRCGLGADARGELINQLHARGFQTAELFWTGETLNITVSWR